MCRGRGGIVLGMGFQEIDIGVGSLIIIGRSVCTGRFRGGQFGIVSVRELSVFGCNRGILVIHDRRGIFWGVVGG